MLIATLLEKGRLVTNEFVFATTYSESDKHHKCTVPAGKRWFLIGGHVTRSQSSTLDVTMKASSDENLWYFCDEAAATSFINYPNIATTATFLRGTPPFPFVMDAGTYIDFLFGAAQAAGDTISCMVIEVDI